MIGWRQLAALRYEAHPIFVQERLRLSPVELFRLPKAAHRRSAELGLWNLRRWGFPVAPQHLLGADWCRCRLTGSFRLWQARHIIAFSACTLAHFSVAIIFIIKILIIIFNAVRRLSKCP